MQKQLHENGRCGTLYLQGKRLVCPACGKQTQVKLLPTTVLTDFPIFCKHCKTETVVNIDESQCQTGKTVRARAD